MRLTPKQLNRATLARQMLLDREALPATDVVRRVVALQAQEPASPYLALWNRVDGLDPTEIDTAFADRSLVKATLMRITLHAVHADDYPAFHEAMVPNLRAARLNDRRFTSTGMSIAEADAIIPLLLEFTAEPRTSSEIEEMLGARLDDSQAKWTWWALRSFAPLAHAPMGEVWSFGRRPAYHPAPTHPPRPDPETSLQHLVWRYLEGFGPASAKDFGQFALQRQPTTKAALAAMDNRLVRLEGLNGEALFDVPGGPLPDGDTPAPPRLMAMWDSTLLAYADRSRIIPPEYRPEVIRSNGDVLPTVLVDGYVAGVWRPIDTGIEVTAFHPFSDDTWDGLGQEAARLMAFLADRDPTVYRRYARWWSDLPGAETRVLSG